MSTKVTLWRVQFCLNNMGIWDSAWFATEAEAQTECEVLIDSEGCSFSRDDGSYGSLIGPAPVEVELTPKGVLEFANNYAVDEA